VAARARTPRWRGRACVVGTTVVIVGHVAVRQTHFCRNLQVAARPPQVMPGIDRRLRAVGPGSPAKTGTEIAPDACPWLLDRSNTCLDTAGVTSMRRGASRPGGVRMAGPRPTALRAVTAHAAKRLGEKTKSASNVLQLPIDEAARGRLAFGRACLHVVALERELRALAEERHRTSGEWARHAAPSLVRTECISYYLALAVESSAPGESGRTSRAHKVQEEFRSALFAIAGSLSRLSDPTASQPELRDLLRELPSLAGRQARIFAALRELFEETG